MIRCHQLLVVCLLGLCALSSAHPTRYEKQVRRSKRDIVVDAKFVGDGLYDPDTKRGDIPVVSENAEPAVAPVAGKSDGNVPESDKVRDVKSTIAKTEDKPKGEKKLKAAKRTESGKTKETPESSTAEAVTSRTHVDGKKESTEDRLTKGMDSNVDHPLVDSDLTKQYTESNVLDHGEMMGIETERVNEPDNGDSSETNAESEKSLLLKQTDQPLLDYSLPNNGLPFFAGNIKRDFVTADVKQKLLTSEDRLATKTELTNGSLSPSHGFTVVKRSASLNNDMLPMTRLSGAHYALIEGGDLADGGPPSHFQVDDKSADLEINANSAGVKVKAKPASLQVVSRPGSHLPHPYVLPVHHYGEDYGEEDFHHGLDDGFAARRSTGCCDIIRHTRSHRRCCIDFPESRCCHVHHHHHGHHHHHHRHHFKRHFHPYHHHYHHHPHIHDDDDDDVGYRRHLGHSSAVTFSPDKSDDEDDGSDGDFRGRRPDVTGSFRHHIPEFFSPNDAAKLLNEAEMTDTSGFDIPYDQAARVRHRMVEDNASTRDQMYGAYGFPNPGADPDPYDSGFGMGYPHKRYHDVGSYKKSSVETVMDPRLGTPSADSGFNSGMALPDDPRFFPHLNGVGGAPMDEGERLRENNLKQIQGSTFKQFADEVAYKQQNINMDTTLEREGMMKKHQGLQEIGMERDVLHRQQGQGQQQQQHFRQQETPSERGALYGHEKQHHFDASLLNPNHPRFSKFQEHVKYSDASKRPSRRHREHMSSSGNGRESLERTHLNGPHLTADQDIDIARSEAAAANSEYEGVEKFKEAARYYTAPKVISGSAFPLVSGEETKEESGIQRAKMITPDLSEPHNDDIQSSEMAAQNSEYENIGGSSYKKNKITRKTR